MTNSAEDLPAVPATRLPIVRCIGCLLVLVGAVAWVLQQPPVASPDGSVISYGRASLLPPIVAILTAIALRRVMLALGLGVFVGAVILQGLPVPVVDPSAPSAAASVEDPQATPAATSSEEPASGPPRRWDAKLLAAVIATAETYIWGALADASHLRVLAFTLLMGAMVGVLNRSGGMHGLVEKLKPLARNRRGGQVTTWALGALVFFDDYANCILLGNTLRPLADRLRISRAKLAYLVDSTAAPIAGLAIVSTWVATEVSYIQDGLENAGIAAGGYEVLVATIPYRFYILFALAFVLLVGLLGRDFGPMLRAERRAAKGELSSADLATSAGHGMLEPDGHVPQRWFNAVVPVLVVVAVVLALLWITGRANLGNVPAKDVHLWNILGNSDSYVALLYGALAGVITAVLLVRVQSLLTVDETRFALGIGTLNMIPGLSVLVMAWALSMVADNTHLQTGAYLSGQLQDSIVPAWLPTIVFVLSGVIAFATGTSWGTMALLMPSAIQVSIAALQSSGETGVTADHPLLLATIAGVLAGSIFGDHCSPISDTTVLSSQGCSCNHLEHVETQAPYALAVAVVAIACGTLPAGYGISPWICIPVGLVAMIALLFVLGRKAEPAGDA